MKRILAFDALASTNSTVRSLALQGAEEGTVVVAETQKQGRGRFDRTWESPKGGAYFSVVLRPKAPLEKTPLLGFVAALAVAHSVGSYRVPARIKWPNDVLVHGKKIAGILLESETSGANVSFVIVGIGVNLNSDLSLFSQDIRKSVTTLCSELDTQIDLTEYLTTFFQQFNRFYHLFLGSHFDQIVEAWRQQSDTLGKHVKVQTTSGILEGTAVDVDESGFLLLTTHDGKTIRVTSGDCSIIE